jgi:hypothetical protein
VFEDTTTSVSREAGTGVRAERTSISIVADAPFARSPNAHETVTPDAVHPLGTVSTDNPVGIVTTIVAAVASVGPLLRAVKESVAVSPGATIPGPFAAASRSANGVIRVVANAVLFEGSKSSVTAKTLALLIASRSAVDTTEEKEAVIVTLRVALAAVDPLQTQLTVLFVRVHVPPLLGVATTDAVSTATGRRSTI